MIRAALLTKNEVEAGSASTHLDFEDNRAAFLNHFDHLFFGREQRISIGAQKTRIGKGTRSNLTQPFGKRFFTVNDQLSTPPLSSICTSGKKIQVLAMNSEQPWVFC